MNRLVSPLSGKLYLHQSAARAGKLAALPGRWALGQGDALTLHAGQAGALRIEQGRLWLTFDNAGQDLRVRAGDHFISRGESLCLSPGDAVVVEPLGSVHAASACFRWDPVAAARCLPAGQA